MEAGLFLGSWWLVGVLGALLQTRYESGYVTLGGLVGIALIGWLLGPVWWLILLGMALYRNRHRVILGGK